MQREHLYRCHAQLINCPRCHEIFNTDQAKDEHTAAEVRCEALTRGAPLEGFNLTQEKLLRSKKKAHKQMTEEEKWMEVYLILFPDLDPENLPTPCKCTFDSAPPHHLPPSSNFMADLLNEKQIWLYIDYEYSDLKQGKSGSPASELSRYEAFLRRELPLRVRQQLEVRIDEALSPIGEVLRAQLVEIVRDMQLELFTIYKSLKTRANDPVGSASSGGGESDHHNARDAPPEGPSAGEQHPELATALELVASSGMESHVEAQAAGSSWDWSLTLEQQLARLPPLPPDAGEDLGHFNGLLFNFE